MNQDILRNHFIDILQSGMKLGAVAKAANVDPNDLSRFKNGHAYLKKESAERLKDYLDRVVIPEC